VREKSRLLLWVIAYLAIGVCEGMADDSVAGDFGEKQTRTREEILSLIEAAGTTKPTWWDSVALEYPETLDLSFPHPPPTKEWNAYKNVGQYMWSIINENESRFQQGTKFMHFILKLNKDDPAVVSRARGQLGHCYHDLLRDWARAAYWKRKARQSDLALANCYWQLGSKEMAVEVLERMRFDNTRYGGIIKLWSDIGELDRALALAKVSGEFRDWGAAERAAGDACRKRGRYEEAIGYYEKVLAVKSQEEDNRILKHNQDHARLAIDHIRLYETFDLGKVRDGTFRASVPAYNGKMVVSVAVQSHRIVNIEILEHYEKQFYSSLTDMPEKIIRAQDYRGIDATTGATVTADAIKSGVAIALSQGVEGE